MKTDYVRRIDGPTTGLASIVVAENGENQIVIVPGANGTLCIDDVENADDLLKASKVRTYTHIYYFYVFFVMVNSHTCLVHNIEY